MVTKLCVLSQKIASIDNLKYSQIIPITYRQVSIIIRKLHNIYIMGKAHLLSLCQAGKLFTIFIVCSHRSKLLNGAQLHRISPSGIVHF